MESAYVFNQSWERELERLRALENVYDPQSRTRLDLLGLGEGAHCLEVGAGAGSMARWMAERAGPAGHVLAVDIDTRFAVGHGLRQLEVREHDLLGDPLPDAAFDMVHARAVVGHQPGREKEAMERMAAATRPGGWMVVEDFDIAGPMATAAARYYPPEHRQLGERVGRAMEAQFAGLGVDPGIGRRLTGLLAEAGLEEIGADVHSPVIPGGDSFMPLTLQHLRPRLVGTGILNDAEVDEAIALMERPESSYVPVFMVTAWGRKRSG
ncbi:methyltransferase domain-containing protein [Wenjunlia tyrosinilytica]|uniref:Methyltransferase n=1 Tax=Wenjunlia tyrosinilytica TaxID=1544741 RepID=A0A917ZLW7_9ACTN|nr:methyltransferase domain-containing protein [Wenjunlia tyrosinilytica]GGO84684.1 methyltransferase [Wenjunlia tyrosinilytica]